jgi:hypothetical protein
VWTLDALHQQEDARLSGKRQVNQPVLRYARMNNDAIAW